MKPSVRNKEYYKELEEIYSTEFNTKKVSDFKNLSETEMLNLALKLYLKVHKLNQKYNKLNDARVLDKMNVYFTLCRIIEAGYPVPGSAKAVEKAKDALSRKLEDMIEERIKNEIVLIEPHHDDALGSAASILFDPLNRVIVYTMSKSGDERDSVDLSKLHSSQKTSVPTNMDSSVKKHFQAELEDYHYDNCYEKTVGRCEDYKTLVDYYIEHDPSNGKIEQTVKEIIYNLPQGEDAPYIFIPLALQHPMHILTTYYCVKYSKESHREDSIIFYVDHPYDYIHHNSDMQISLARKESTKQFYENMLGISYIRADAIELNQAEAAHLLEALYGKMHYGEFGGSLENTMCSYLVPKYAAQELCGMFHLKQNNILYASFQAKPFSKTGGLGEVAFTYVKSMQSYVNQIAVITPKYRTIMNNLTVITRKNGEYYFVHYKKDGMPVLGAKTIFSEHAIELLDIDSVCSCDFTLMVFGSKHNCHIEKYLWQGVTYYLLDIQGYFNDRNLFDGKNADIEPALFARAVLESQKGYLDIRPSLIHCNDNQTAMIPFLLKTEYRELAEQLKTVYTIHFYGYQGIHDRKRIIKSIGLSENSCTQCLWCNRETNRDCVFNKISPYGKEELAELGIPDDKISFMKTGINYADYVTTVSEGYASEISRYPDFENINHVYGIRNGVIVHPHPELNYEGTPYIDISDCSITPAEGDLSGTVQEGKSVNKELFQQECHFLKRQDVPLLCMVSRLNILKGAEQIKNIFDSLMKLDIQFVIIGDDDRNVMVKDGKSQIAFSPYADFFTRKMQEYPDKFRYYTFSEEMEFKAYRASDILIMPSLSEACGTTQILAMKNGVIPILSMLPSFFDTVIDYGKTIKSSIAGQDESSMEFYIGKPEGMMDRGVGFFAYKDDCRLLLSVIEKACRTYKEKKDLWRRIVNSTYMTDFSWENGSLFKYLCLYNNRPDWICRH